MTASGYEIIGDLAHEVPEVADAVLAWKRGRAEAAVRAAIERDRQARIDAAWESLLARDRAGRPESE